MENFEFICHGMPHYNKLCFKESLMCETQLDTKLRAKNYRREYLTLSSKICSHKNSQNIKFLKII